MMSEGHPSFWLKFMEPSIDFDIILQLDVLCWKYGGTKYFFLTRRERMARMRHITAMMISQITSCLYVQHRSAVEKHTNTKAVLTNYHNISNSTNRKGWHINNMFSKNIDTIYLNMLYGYCILYGHLTQLIFI